MRSYLSAMSKYFDFHGRSRASEYWFFMLTVLLAYMFLMTVLALIYGGSNIKNTGPAMIIVGLFYLIHIIPMLSVTVRRLHDSNRSGWWVLISIVPLIGQITLLIFMCMHSTYGSNRFGPGPMSNAFPMVSPPPPQRLNVDVIPQLEKLANLWASGAIDDDEYQRMKANLVQRQLS